MVGTLPPGELSGRAGSPSATPAPVRFAVATMTDEVALRQLLRRNPMPGAIRIGFEREPDFFRGLGLGGARDRTIVAYAGGRLVCMGRCSIRPGWVNGRVTRVGYLAELRLDHSARGEVRLLRDGYRFFHELAAHDADVFFTSIASDNLRARRLLERGLPGFPEYRFLAELTTLLIPTRAGWLTRLSPPGARTFNPASGVPSHEEITDLLNTANRGVQFAACWEPATLAALAAHDLPAGSFHVLRSSDEPIAAAALWDQRAFRQTVIHGYSGALAAVRPMHNGIASMLGRSLLPRPGTVLSHAFVSPLALAPGHEERLAEVVRTLRSEAARRGLDALTLALPAPDPRLRELTARFHCRRYQTRLYQVVWPGTKPLELDGRPILPDVSLL